MSNYRVLSDLEPDRLELEAARSSYPKWATLCLLRYARLKTLDACFLPPGVGDACIAAAQEFAVRARTNRLLVRSDGGIETKEYLRGGNSLSVKAAGELAVTLARTGRAVILMESTNRFTNRLSANLLMHRGPEGGSFIMEILGPGYDISDLNRAVVTPQVLIETEDVNWRCYHELWRSSLKIRADLTPEADRRRRENRLTRIGSELLPAIGVSIRDEPMRAAESWLKSHRYCGLWEAWNAPVEFSTIMRWYDDAFMIACTYPNRDWTTLACSASDLGDGRVVFWDVVDAARKFGRPKPVSSAP